jgi:hypothetical protein
MAVITLELGRMIREVVKVETLDELIGTQVYPNGDKYIGEWAYNQRNGKGGVCS